MVSCPPLAYCVRITVSVVPAAFGNTAVWKVGGASTLLSEWKQMEMFYLQNLPNQCFAFECLDHCATFLLLQVAKSPYY